MKFFTNSFFDLLDFPRCTKHQTDYNFHTLTALTRQNQRKKGNEKRKNEEEEENERNVQRLLRVWYISLAAHHIFFAHFFFFGITCADMHSFEGDVHRTQKKKPLCSNSCACVLEQANSRIHYLCLFICRIDLLMIFRLLLSLDTLLKIHADLSLLPNIFICNLH